MYKLVFVCLIVCMFVCNLTKVYSEEIDLASATRDEVISVKFIASNEKKCKFVIHNQTDRPLKIKLPSTFAAVPVLAQFNNAGIVPNNPQRLGGGLQQNNAFPVNPFGTIVVPVNTICLDFGLPTPNTKTRFKIVPIHEVSYDPKINTLLIALAENRISQKVAQIAIWNMHSQTSFRDIANTGFFAHSEIMSAQSVITNL